MNSPNALIPTSARGAVVPAAYAGGGATSEIGYRSTPERSFLAMQTMLMVNYTLRDMILQLREMDRADGRVKKIHTRLARDITRGGLVLKMATPNGTIQRAWEGFQDRLDLCNPQKLKSHARGLIIEGNLPIQWVLDDLRKNVVDAVRMPTETLKPIVTPAGRFLTTAEAYHQYDWYTGQVIAKFPLWQLTWGRLDPNNYDDLGDPGRAYLDATREVWLKLRMTETDMVIRRHERAPQRTAHVLENATETELNAYKARVEDDQKDITSNYYLTKKGSVNAIQGDANLEQIADVVHLLETFFAGGPAPAGLFGYTEDISRDILEDLTQDYFQEVDSGQESQAWVYRQGFELDLMLKGIDPANYDFQIGFTERLTETPSQSADRALKLQALGASQTTVLGVAGLDANTETERRQAEADTMDPYPPPGGNGGQPNVKVTPGNAPKGNSSTTIQTRG